MCNVGHMNDLSLSQGDCQGSIGLGPVGCGSGQIFCSSNVVWIMCSEHMLALLSSLSCSHNHNILQACFSSGKAERPWEKQRSWKTVLVPIPFSGGQWITEIIHGTNQVCRWWCHCESDGSHWWQAICNPLSLLNKNTGIFYLQCIMELILCQNSTLLDLMQLFM